MRRLIILGFYLIISLRLSAQVYKDSIRNQFGTYTELLKNKEFAKSMDYMNQDFINLVSKKQLLELLEKTFNNPEMDIELKGFNIIAIGDSKLINGKSYSKIKYSNLFKMRQKAETLRQTDTLAIINSLEEKFGKGNVSYDKSSAFYTVLAIKNVVANSKDKKHWTFVVVEEKQKPLLERFISKELL